MLFLLIVLLLFGGSLSVCGQTAADTITISKSLDEVEIIQNRAATFVERDGSQMVVAADELKEMPKFLGTSDPIRYMQSLAGIQTNNETSTGLHIQGCEDYQTLVSINAAPIYYPNHPLGLFSTFIAPHFESITIEQAEHSGTMGNRIGGRVDFETQHNQPKRFSMEGNLGLISADLSMAIPCSKKHSLFLSARTSYINWLYGKLLKIREDYALRYHFMDYNLTYAGQLTDKDELVISGFYSRDKINLNMDIDIGAELPISWQNITGSAYWNHRDNWGNWRTSVYYSSFDNAIQVASGLADVQTDALFSSVGIKNKVDLPLTDAITFSASADYEHYIVRPLFFRLKGINTFESETEPRHYEHADEAGVGANIRHDVRPWFAYEIGFYASLYAHQSKTYLALDPRATLHFYPAEHHELALHYGMYHQNFHKAGLVSGGMPMDFMMLATENFQPEWSHSVNLRYTADFLNKQYNISAELYFKQMYNTLESTGNVLQLLNQPFSYDVYMKRSDGRNWGLNVMFQRSRGIVTGYISYTLGWALRRMPDLEGIQEYVYPASHERRHDLKIVLNSQFAKRWHIGAMFVLASGIPYTKPEEVYVFNGDLFFRYGRHNGANVPLYHRLDISASCDIIKKNEHELGINVSIYNVYAHKNVQFMMYTPQISIVPSISIYGKF